MRDESDRGARNISESKSRPAPPSLAASAPARAAEELLRKIPSVEEVLHWPALRELVQRTSRRFLTERVREVLAGLRKQIRDGQWLSTMPTLSETFLEARIREAVEVALAYSLRPVINATGVVLHTNLGRAPLSREALQHAVDVATQY